jgi:hypothetical protein
MGVGVRLDDEKRTVYVEAYDRWKRDLDALHRVLLDGDPLDPPHFVALLRRESKSKARYDDVRERVLGLPGGDDADDPFGDDE